MTLAARRLSLADATSLIDRAFSRGPAEWAVLSAAGSRVAAEEVHAARPIPRSDRAAVDGFAVAADATIGASSYNPLVLPVRAISAGDAIPPGCDAVIPLALAQPLPADFVECIEPLAPGENVEMRGSAAAPGALLASAGTLLSPAHLGVLAGAGLTGLRVTRRPVLRILVAPRGEATDSNGPMCETLVCRDGGVVIETLAVERSRQGIRSALEMAGADIALVVGGTGPGPDDHAAAALADAGELAFHGVALRPGETVGLGHTAGGVPVILLPGAPAACFVGYEMLAGRAVRHLGGRNPGLPYRSRVMRLARKIVSAIGTTEICPIRCTAGDAVEPLPSFAEIGLLAAIAADGFVIVAEGSEGRPQGAQVTVYLYEGKCIGG
ncbi:MAG TPA: molybdopterin-binding protein [Stellaceae bacterium]|nr:molybdopterin-binding protein [Stellaceae bacterium]